MMRGSSTSYAALSWGKSFTTEELMNAEQTLSEAGLNDFRREGNKIMVPASEAETYHAALAEGGSLPLNWGSELEKQMEKGGLFSTPEDVNTRKMAALSNYLDRVLSAIPAIEKASVVLAPSKKRGYSQRGSSVTAAVNVTPRRGHELTMQLVQGIRVSVANAVPDLNSTGVVIFDQRNGKAHTAETDDAYDNKLLTRIQQFEKDYYTKITSALSYIDDVIVTVNVDVEKIKTSVRRSQKLDPKSFETFTNSRKDEDTSREEPDRGEPGNKPNQPRNLQMANGDIKTRTTKKTDSTVQNIPIDVTHLEEVMIGAMPEAVQVSISIPEDYYVAVAAKQGFAEGTTQQEKDAFQASVDLIRQNVKTNVEETVKRNIPQGSPVDSISVIAYTPIDSEEIDTSPTMTQSVGNAMSQWGGAIGLGLFALWTLWMLNKSMTKLPDINEEMVASLNIHQPEEEEEETEDDMADLRETSLRDGLQSVVRDSPELTASVLAKWIQEEKPH